mgnify:CR=1 FL=1
MVYGKSRTNMSNILNDLGVDKEDFDWWHLAICRGMDTNLFYDKYEIDINTAKNIEINLKRKMLFIKKTNIRIINPTLSMYTISNINIYV